MYRQPRSGFTRIPFVADCTVEIHGVPFHGLICNLSVLGAYLHLDPMPDSGTPVTVRFVLPDGGPPLAAAATISWQNEQGTRGDAASAPGGAGPLPAGCGVRFTGLTALDIRRLVGLVAEFQTEPQSQVAVEQPFTGKVRIPYVAPCVVSGAFGIARGSICNLSELGVYASLDRLPELGASVIVSFRLPGSDSALFERAAVVAWRNPETPGRVHVLPPGCGFRFVNLSPEDEGVLAILVQKYLDSLPTRVA